MRRRLIAPIFLFLLVSASHAADDPVAKAMKLYEKRHYAEAADLLRDNQASVAAARQGAAQLTLGMAYLKNAELHSLLYRQSLAVHLDYLQKLAAGRGRARSRFADLYLGEALLASDKIKPALQRLEKFAADASVDARSKTEAQALIGLCYQLTDNKQKAEEIWSSVNKSDPGMKAALANAYRRAGLRDRNPVALVDESLAALKKSGSAPSMPHISNALAVYAAAGQPEKGLEALRSADLKAFSYRESIDKSKIINFYDLSLLGNLSSLYLQAGIAALEKAARTADLRETAGFYLGEAHSLAGNIDQSIKANAAFIASPSMPEQYRDKATVRQAANQYRKGRQFDAIGTWDDLAAKKPGDPDLLAEILLVCGRLGIACPKIAQKSAAAVEAGEGRRYSTLNIALGKYYLSRKDLVKAASYLETGRDKGNKNKIESNDPAMLVSLAETYYRTKKFSEALEIYFEMSREFPQVRQLQEALQGIYAMEHKSAGDVKIN